MKVTVSAIKADVGSIGGHIRPSEKLLKTVEDSIKEKGKGFFGLQCYHTLSWSTAGS